MSCCCCYCVRETIVPCVTRTVEKVRCYPRSASPCCSCCAHDELTLLKLKNTNSELKSLINRLDDLSETVKTSCSHSHCYCSCCTVTTHLYHECSFCKRAKEASTIRTYQYDLVICDDCERMMRISEEIDKRKARTDPNIYPLDKYPVATHRSRSRSKTRRCYDYSSSSSPEKTNYVTPEPRPAWNGGPYVSSYLWRDWKLRESKSD